MQFKTYDEVEPDNVAQLTIAGFGWNLSAETVKKLRKKDRNCTEWFAMYAVENDKVLAQVGASYPDIRTTEGKMKLGYVWGVTTLPDHARKGISRKLMEKTHLQMREDGIEIFALSTHKSLVAHGFYESIGYIPVQNYAWGGRKVRKKPEGNLRLKVRKRSNKQTHDLFKEFSRGAYGFVHRHPRFVEPRCLWFPYVTDVCTFFRGETPVGFALVSDSKKSLFVREICCPDVGDITDCVSTLERKLPRNYIYTTVQSRKDVIDALGGTGLAPTNPHYGVLMMRPPKGRKSTKALRALVGADKGKFQFTSTDEY
jgi:predicted acetyltransferase